jgi:hypothetical protein
VTRVPVSFPAALGGSFNETTASFGTLGEPRLISSRTRAAPTPAMVRSRQQACCANDSLLTTREFFASAGHRYPALATAYRALPPDRRLGRAVGAGHRVVRLTRRHAMSIEDGGFGVDPARHLGSSVGSATRTGRCHPTRGPRRPRSPARAWSRRSSRSSGISRQLSIG